MEYFKRKNAIHDTWNSQFDMTDQENRSAAETVCTVFSSYHMSLTATILQNYKNSKQTVYNS